VRTVDVNPSDHEPDPVACAETVRDGIEVDPQRRRPGWTEPNEAVAHIVGPILGIHLAQPHEHVGIGYVGCVGEFHIRHPSDFEVLAKWWAGEAEDVVA
jgi:hypothetical protein